MDFSAGRETLTARGCCANVHNRCTRETKKRKKGDKGKTEKNPLGKRDYVARIEPDRGSVFSENGAGHLVRCTRIFITHRRKALARREKFGEGRPARHEQGTSYDPGAPWNIINEPVTFAPVCERPRRMLQSLLSTVKCVPKCCLYGGMNLFGETIEKRIINPDLDADERTDLLKSEDLLLLFPSFILGP